MAPRIASIRRYPVKSMGGESLDDVALTERGLAGDRWFAVQDAEGHFASGKNTRRFRRRDEVFDFAARTDAGGAVRVSGPGVDLPAGDPVLDTVLSERMGAPVRVLPEASVSHFDDCPVSLVGTATLVWCAEHWGIDADPRRLRVNLVVETQEPFVEEAWLGQRHQVGGASLEFVKKVERCRMIDVAQDGASAEGRWLKPLSAEREMCAAVYARVVVPGMIRLGDALRQLSSAGLASEG